MCNGSYCTAEGGGKWAQVVRIFLAWAKFGLCIHDRARYEFCAFEVREQQNCKIGA